MKSECAENETLPTEIFLGVGLPESITSLGSLSNSFASVPSTQYPVMMTPFLSLQHHFSNNYLECPLCSIPGLAITTSALSKSSNVSKLSNVLIYLENLPPGLNLCLYYSLTYELNILIHFAANDEA